MASKTKPMQIVYHGTNKANAQSIVKNGFRPGTYFGIHQEDALGYGGNYLFEVAIESDKIPKGVDWEFCNDELIKPSKIVSLTQYRPARKIIEDEGLRAKVFESNMPKVSLKPKPAKQRIPTLKTSIPKKKPRGKIIAGVGYADKQQGRLTRKPHRGWKKVKYL